MKKYIALIISMFLLVTSFGSVHAAASTSPVFNVSVINNATGEKQMAKIPVSEIALTRSGEEQTIVGEVFVKIPEDGAAPIELMDAITYANTTTDSSSNQNIYWKATVSVTYSADGTYCTFSKASASWTKLRGVTTLSNRSVYWGYTLGIKTGGKTYSPTSNSVSYSTGLGAMKYGQGSVIGCNSSALITLQSGFTVTLEANIMKDL